MLWMPEMFKEYRGELNHHVRDSCSVSGFSNGKNRWFLVAFTERNTPRARFTAHSKKCDN
jgi:hypothetical protein